jgi:hypothetical protein
VDQLIETAIGVTDAVRDTQSRNIAEGSMNIEDGSRRAGTAMIVIENVWAGIELG